MNWKRVLSLMRVDRKSGRLIRGQKLTRYRENLFFAYWPYWVGLGIGLAVGLLAGFGYNLAFASDLSGAQEFQQAALSLFFSLPTLVLIYSMVFTMLQQIQKSGVKVSTQAPYWLPVTWQEHTLASILASLLGFPLASVFFIASAAMIFSFFAGLVIPALASSLAVFAAAFMASTTTEILRILQVRFIGAVYKSTGRAAVWVRFAGSLLFFIIFYILYFYVVSGSGALSFIQTIASAQNSAWFIPFVWLGLTLYSLTGGLFLQGIIFLILSLIFIGALFGLATLLNKRFGLYEPPAITISRGVYAPKTGFLGRLGFSLKEAAIIRKDLRAFTRRRELMTVFIVPIVIILVPIMQTLGQTQAMPPSITFFFAAMTFLFPSSILAMSLGTFMMGEEGQAVWRLYSSPVSEKNLVRSKYFFIALFALIILAATGTFGAVMYHLSFRATFIAFVEGGFLVFALGAISLSNGIKGADFTETPRPRMIRQSTSFLNLLECFLGGIAILVPFVPYLISSTISQFVPNLSIANFLDPYIATVISGIITFALAAIFYRASIRNAKKLLEEAEV
jgi:hypothetical protein